MHVEHHIYRYKVGLCSVWILSPVHHRMEKSALIRLLLSTNTAGYHTMASLHHWARCGEKPTELGREPLSVAKRGVRASLKCDLHLSLLPTRFTYCLPSSGTGMPPVVEFRLQICRLVCSNIRQMQPLPAHNLPAFIGFLLPLLLLCCFSQPQ
jgi:hypothetical protein